MKDWITGNESLRLEWDSENELPPESTFSSKRSWWKCCSGHRWQVSPWSRIRNKSGCPYCGHHLPSPEYNLAISYPDLMVQWDYEKNEILPTEVLPGSVRKVWWRCGKNHSWQASVLNRARKGSGCPYCSGLMATPKNNLTLFPDLMRQFNYEKNVGVDPKRITKSSMKMLWWRCVNGHEWKTSPNSRRRGTGCPKCHKKFSRLEVRLWAEMFKLFGCGEWSSKVDGIEVDVYFDKWKVGVEVDGWYWHKDRMEQDKSKEDRLMKLGIKMVRVREIPLPLIGGMDVGYTNSEPGIRVVLRVVKAVSSLVGIDVRNYLNSGCFWGDDLYTKKLSELEFPRTSVLDTNPELELEFHKTKNGSITLANISYMSNRKMWWMCENGHEWQTVVSVRTRGDGKCPVCREEKRMGKLQKVSPGASKPKASDQKV